jgi:hypothetical protein
MTEKQVADLLDGVALLERLGDLYEYIGTDENGKLLFQSVNDDHYIRTSYENLLTMPEYEVKF